ncbi:uncharacterized protein LOC131332400 [Rhododendron vialii]|uniref:uncharacterized protein LOC131332400 n=1 Tax=Rhododendron vialii TaxID=182163 RepID=UPI0026601FDA|nr:uncharacterized protein LOC131332400 [Rhododendron vialii]
MYMHHTCTKIYASITVDCWNTTLYAFKNFKIPRSLSTFCPFYCYRNPHSLISLSLLKPLAPSCVITLALLHQRLGFQCRQCSKTIENMKLMRFGIVGICLHKLDWYLSCNPRYI